MTQLTHELTLEGRLEAFGDPRETWRWREGDPDYVEALGISAADAPRLLAVAREWVEREDWPDDPNDMTVYAPVHAWRAAAQLGAVEAIDVLLDMLGPMDEQDDDWHLEEFPWAFAWIGPASIAPLRTYLADQREAAMARVCVGHALKEVARRHAGSRAEVVHILSTQLEHFPRQPEELNGFLISFLLGLKATESADVIERAFAADRVDLTILGNWNEVRKELGVEGRGLVPESLASEHRPIFPEVRTMSPTLDLFRSYAASDQERRRRRARNKRERRNRKRRGRRR